MAATDEMLDIAKKVNPDYVTLVPEKREEITTEGGLNIENKKEYLSDFVKDLKKANIKVSAFIDPITNQIQNSKDIGFDFIELHTGTYSELLGQAQENELQKLIEATYFASDLGLVVNAGHGLNFQNVIKIASIYNINELNIGHSIVSRALAVGLSQSVREMKNLISEKN